VKILLPVLSALLLIGCTGDEKEPTQKAASSAPQETAVKAVEPAPVPAPEPETKPVQPAEAVKAEAPKETVTEEAAPAPKAETPAPAVETAINGATLFKQKCATCHGQAAEKSALNVSEPIAGWEVSRTVDALNGYKAGTYGKNMKGMMQGQVKTISDAEIQALAEFISKQ
jgi:cytochrome c553